MSRFITILFCLGLGACGMKTALQLPPGPAQEPLLGNPKSAASTANRPSATTAGDVSTDKKTHSQ